MCKVNRTICFSDTVFTEEKSIALDDICYEANLFISTLYLFYMYFAWIIYMKYHKLMVSVNNVKYTHKYKNTIRYGGLRPPYF